MTLSLYYDALKAPDIKLIMERLKVQLEQEAENRRAFYEWITPVKKAEFINGEVVMHSPVKRRHLLATKRISTLLSLYALRRNLGEVDTEKAMVSLSRNDYEPDICFWRKEVADEFELDMLLHPAPDLIVEVLSPSTEMRDRGVKFKDYAAHGVKEYWIVDPDQETVEVYTLDTDRFIYKGGDRLHKSEKVKNEVVVGFWVPVRAFFEEASFRNVLEGER